MSTFPCSLRSCPPFSPLPQSLTSTIPNFYGSQTPGFHPYALDPVKYKSKFGSTASPSTLTTDLAYLRNVDCEYSGYNPPPPHRSLLGDVGYLDVTIPGGDSDKITVTCNGRGFYVNGCGGGKGFVPNMVQGGKIYGTIMELMCEVGGDVFVGKPNRHTNDKTRTERWISGSMSECDWNEEISVSRLLPSSNPSERHARGRQIYVTTQAFHDACVNAVEGVANGVVQPVNEGEVTDRWVYVTDHIFVSTPNVVDDTFHLIEREAAGKMMNRDVGNVAVIGKEDHGECRFFMQVMVER